ncbi:MAG: DAK2 domain-containing protein, partial [Bacillota bacterium]
ITSLMVYNPEADLEKLKAIMTDEIGNVKTIELTTAVKDSKVNEIEINEGDIIGLYNHDIKSVGCDYKEVLGNLINDIYDYEELVTIYYGEDVIKEDAVEIQKYLEENFDFDEIEIYNGKQPLYPYLISLE